MHRLNGGGRGEGKGEHRTKTWIAMAAAAATEYRNERRSESPQETNETAHNRTKWRKPESSRRSTKAGKGSFYPGDRTKNRRLVC
ncbi:hypothetical protein KSS87_005867 [Heliosperma pusillum]|nr:hypothetical protein KSS87_005867 [Heliosperma pusillum]